MLPVPILGRLSKAQLLCPHSVLPTSSRATFVCGSGLVPISADGSIQILCPAVTVTAVTALGLPSPAPPLTLTSGTFLKLQWDDGGQGTLSIPRGLKKLPFPVMLPSECLCKCPTLLPVPLSLPCSSSGAKIPWDQHPTSISNSALCASASSPRTAFLREWWKSQRMQKKRLWWWSSDG